MEKLSNELKSLVENKMLSEDEAKLIQAVRSGDIENPIKTDSKEVEVNAVEQVIKDINSNIEIGTVIVEKISKAIEILEDNHIFKNQEFLSEKDVQNLKCFTSELKDKFVEAIEKFEYFKELNIHLKKEVELFSTKVENLFSNSTEVNDKILEDNLKIIEEQEKNGLKGKSPNP